MTVTPSEMDKALKLKLTTNRVVTQKTNALLKIEGKTTFAEIEDCMSPGNGTTTVTEEKETKVIFC